MICHWNQKKKTLKINLKVLCIHLLETVLYKEKQLENGQYNQLVWEYFFSYKAGLYFLPNSLHFLSNAWWGGLKGLFPRSSMYEDLYTK